MPIKLLNKVSPDISSWNVNIALATNEDYKFRDYYFYRYIYTFNSDGTIIKIQANDNYKSTEVKKMATRKKKSG